MSKIGERQSAVVKFIREHPNDEVKRQEIVDQFKHWYYCNGEKHVSDIIHRCVKRGLIERSRHGYYRIRTAIALNQKTEIDPNQKSLF